MERTDYNVDKDMDNMYATARDRLAAQGFEPHLDGTHLDAHNGDFQVDISYRPELDVPRHRFLVEVYTPLDRADGHENFSEVSVPGATRVAGGLGYRWPERGALGRFWVSPNGEGLDGVAKVVEKLAVQAREQAYEYAKPRAA